MKTVSSYYSKVLYWIAVGQNGYFKEAVVDRIMREEPDLIDQLDALRECLKRHLVAYGQHSEGPSVVLEPLSMEDRDAQAITVAVDEANDNKELPVMADHEEKPVSTLDIELFPENSSTQHPVEDIPLPTTCIESLPNGRTGQHYSLCLDEVLVLPKQVELTLEDDAGTNLELTADHCLRGELQGAGSVQLSVLGRDEYGADVIRLMLKLAIIPSSRDLWKDLPSDPKVQYAKSDEDSARLMLEEGWQIAMASLRGRAHAHHGGQRDDHGIIEQVANGWQVLVVADGAGSCEFSREGSRLAATAAVATLQEALDEAESIALEEAVQAYWASEDRSTRIPQPLVQHLQNTVITAVHRAHLAIHQEAERSGHPIKSFSSTLLLALHKSTKHGHIVISFGVGDGAIAALEQVGNVHLMNNVDSGEHAGQTRFLDSMLFQDSALLYQRLNVRVIPSLKALILATDGVTDPKFSSDRELQDPEAWEDFLASLRPALQEASTAREPLLDYLSFFIERHHDDRTLAVLFQCQEEDEGIQVNGSMAECDDK